MAFTKMSGTGNDFIVVDAFHAPGDTDWSKLAARFCPRRTGVGVDGLLLLGPDDEVDFAYRIFNADGSEAEMCGNGARCAAAFALRHGIAGKSMSFRTLAGIVEARVNPEDVSIRVTDPKDLRRDTPLQVDGRTLSVWSVNTGVPHAVVFTDDLERVPVDSLGRAVRRHPAFSPAGTNVDFVQRVSGSSSLGGSRSRPRSTPFTSPLKARVEEWLAARSTLVVTAAKAGVSIRKAWATPIRRMFRTASSSTRCQLTPSISARAGSSASGLEQ